MMNDIVQQIKKNEVIRYLQQRGEQTHFNLYGTNCILMLKNDYYYFGAQFTKSKADKLSTEQFYDVLMVLVGNDPGIELNLFVSEKDYPFIFTRKNKRYFSIDKWEKEFERLLVVNSILENMLIKQQPHQPLKSQTDKNWIIM